MLAATFVGAAVLRFIALGHGLWYDEIVTLVLSARHPVRQIVTEFPGVNAHPLYSLLAHAALVTFGESGWALRLPAALFGIASVVMVYVLAARYLSRVEAWVATAVIATSYHHVWFSQNARGYTLIGFLTLLSTFFLIRAGETGRRRDYVIYALAAAAGVYTHLTMAFVVAGHAVVMMGGHLVRWSPARERPLMPMVWAWTGAALVSSAAYAPFIPGIIALMGLEETQQAAGVATAGWALGEALRALLAGTGIPAALVGGAFAMLGGLSLLRRAPLLVGLLVMPAIVTGATLVLVGQPLRPRFFFFLSAAAAIFVGRGIGAVATWFAARGRSAPGRSATVGVVVLGMVLIAMSAVALPTAYRVPKQDFDGAVALLDAEERRGATIAVAGPACLPLERYYLKTWACLETPADWRQVTQGPGSVLVVSTLSDYIEDPELRRLVGDECHAVRRFPATLGGGDIVVCAPRTPR